MPSHSNKAIMDMINGSVDLQKKWNELILQMEQNVRDQFYGVMGVPIPRLMEAQVLHIDATATFATKASVQEYVSGVAGLIGSVFEENWPAVALDATNLVGTIAAKIIGNGEIKVGLNGDGHSITVPSKNDPAVQITWVVAVFTVTQECKASDWATDESFYGSSYVFVLWKPTGANLRLLKK